MEGPVFADGERWETIDEALDELGIHGWEIKLPVYGPIRDDAAAVGLEGFVMVNMSVTLREDLQRRISRLEQDIAHTRRELANPSVRGEAYGHIKYGIEQDEKQLERLQTRLIQCRAEEERKAPHGRPLAYGEFREGRMSTEDDFALAQWRPEDDDERGD